MVPAAKIKLTFQKFLNTIKTRMSITYQPKKKKRKHSHGFIKRQRTKGGKRVLVRRRRKKRWELTV